MCPTFKVVFQSIYLSSICLEVFVESLKEQNYSQQHPLYFTMDLNYLFDSLCRLDEIQSENMKLKVENSKLSRKVESIKNENHNIGVMEQEKDSLKQTVAQMKATIDSLQKTQSKQVRSSQVQRSIILTLFLYLGRVGN